MLDSDIIEFHLVVLSGIELKDASLDRSRGNRESNVFRLSRSSIASRSNSSSWKVEIQFASSL